MNKKLRLIILFLFFINISISQTAISVSPGNWTNPSTWSCGCVPTPGYAVTINHNVVLNTSFGYTSGSITINFGGSLISDALGRDLLINGGSFSNNGTFDVRFLFAQAGSFTNGGVISVNAFLNNVNFFNTGVFQNIDSLTNNAIITNNNGMLNIDSLTNNGIITNNGISSYNQFTNNGNYTNNNYLSFQDVTNNGTINNSDSIQCDHSMWNQGRIVNQQYSYIRLDKSLLNRNVLNGTASINNNGEFIIMDSFYNYDTIKGTTGKFEIQDTSLNYGNMLQSFDFCDHTPPAMAPFIDLNFGSVSSGITWCLSSGIPPELTFSFSVFPNPVVDILFFDFTMKSDYEVEIFDLCGKLCMRFINPTSIDFSDYRAGTYFLSILHNEERVVKKIQVIK